METLRLVADLFVRHKARVAVEPIRSAEVSFCHTVAGAKAMRQTKIPGWSELRSAGIPQQALDNWYVLGNTIGMKTAISIPDRLFKTVDAAARNLGLSRSALIRKALEDFLDNQNQKSVIEKLNKVYSKVDSSIPATIRKYQRSTIRKEDW